MTTLNPPFRRRMSSALSKAVLYAACIAAAPAIAQIATTGAVSPPVGPGNTDVGNTWLMVGHDGPGTLDVSGGALLGTGALIAGPSSSGNGHGTITVSGAGTRLELKADGFDVINRLGIGEWGIGRLTVSGGAVLDGTVNGAACLGLDHHCNAYIGNAAGSDGTFTVTGAGTAASFLRGFLVGGVSVFRPPIDGFTFGTPGGTTRGVVNVLDGATLNTETASLGLAPSGGSPTGRERSFADVLISGPGSVWNVRAGSLEAAQASIYASGHANSWATIRIENGGKLAFEAPPNFFNGLRLTQNGGRSDMVVTGAGSAVDFNGGLLYVGRRLGTAILDVLAGGRLNDIYYMAVGRDAAQGTMTIDGAGSVVSVNRAGPIGTTDAGIGALVHIGRNGTGTLTVSNGGRLDIVNASVNDNPNLLLGVGAASAGTLNITGANSVVSISSASIVAGGGASETLNPTVSIGHHGRGTLNITAGGKLLVEGNAVSTPTHTRSTPVNIGGFSDTQPGGNGIAVVDGAGSELRVTATDAFIGIGRGPTGTGQLTISDQGLVTSTVMSVGRGGGVGILRMDNGLLQLAGQQSGGNLSGAVLTIGSAGGIGNATLSNGSVVNISNMGSDGAHLVLGGTSARPLGDGSLTLGGGSQINVNAMPGMATMTVGRDGSGLVRVREASTIDLGDGNLYVGRFAGSDGTMILNNDSSVTAGYVGVGRNKNSDGGTGTLVVSSGSVLNATTIEIGTNGFLGGNGSISGAITNYGIVSPGSSPGTLTIDGSFINAAGGRLFLEVESNGLGGFNTDQLVFTEGSSIDFGGTDITFRFLGGTDPNAFQTSGNFHLDTFFSQQLGAGHAPLDAGLFGGVTFGAQADNFIFQSFAFDPLAGASFAAAPVPEPSQWLMLAMGGLLIGGVVRRRRSAAARPLAPE